MQRDSAVLKLREQLDQSSAVGRTAGRELEMYRCQASEGEGVGREGRRREGGGEEGKEGGGGGGGGGG